MNREPDVVVEARRALRRARIVGGSAIVGVFLALGAVLALTLDTPLLALGLINWGVLLLVGYEIYPVGRDASWARRVLKRWDELRSDRAFEELAAAPDPRMRSARAMAARIVADASADSQTRAIVEAVLDDLHSALSDVRTLEQARVAAGDPADEASDPELRTALDAGIARLTGSLAEAYRAVVASDSMALRDTLLRMEDITRRVEADAEVRALLEGRAEPADGTGPGWS